MIENNSNNFSDERGLHPLTLLYNAFRNAPALVISLYYGVIQKDSGEWFYSLIMIMVLFTILPGLLLNFIFFKFRITDREIYINSGIIAKKKRVIPLTKVQNVNLSQNFLQKLFGLTRVQIETAGDIQAEGVLEFVSNKDAEAISNIIKQYQSNQEIIQEKLHSSEDKFALSTSSEDETLFKMSIKDILIYGAMRFRPLFLIFGFWLYTTLQQFSFLNNQMTDFLEENVDNLRTMDWVSLSFFISASIIIIILISWIMDIIWTANIHYGFTLKNEKNKLIINSGFLNKQMITIPFKKVQQISIITNILKQKFGFYSLRLFTAGFGLQSKGNDLAVPNATINKIYEVIDKIKNYRIPDEFNQISKKSIRRAFFRYAMFLLFVTGIISYNDINGLFILVLLPILYYFAFLDWKNRGYYFEGNTLFIKYGVIIKKINIMSVNKIQIMRIRETFFQRRLGLSTLILDTAAVASGSETVIRDIDKDVAQQLFEIINEKLNINIIRKGIKL